jgi:hypothetical protein
MHILNDHENPEVKNNMIHMKCTIAHLVEHIMKFEIYDYIIGCADGL